MNCHACRVGAGTEQRPAYALCQGCGVGLCEEHLIEVCSPLPSGMAGAGGVRRRLLCQRCYQPAGTSTQPLATGTRWWHKLFGRASSPATEQATIVSVEAFLKEQRDSNQ